MFCPDRRHKHPSLCFLARQARHGTSAHSALREGLMLSSLCKSHLKCFLKLVKYTFRNASQKMKVHKKNKHLRTMLCFPSKVNFWILWNYRQMTRNTEYWESAIILCKPLTHILSLFCVWLSHTSQLQGKELLLKSIPPQQLISPGYREGTSLISPC